MIQYAGSIERALPGRTTLTVNVTDSRGVHDLRERQINAYLPGTYNPRLRQSGGVLPYPGQGYIYQYQNYRHLQGTAGHYEREFAGQQPCLAQRLLRMDRLPYQHAMRLPDEPVQHQSSTGVARGDARRTASIWSGPLDCRLAGRLRRLFVQFVDAVQYHDRASTITATASTTTGPHSRRPEPLLGGEHPMHCVRQFQYRSGRQLCADSDQLWQWPGPLGSRDIRFTPLLGAGARSAMSRRLRRWWPRATAVLLAVAAVVAAVAVVAAFGGGGRGGGFGQVGGPASPLQHRPDGRGDRYLQPRQPGQSAGA